MNKNLQGLRGIFAILIVLHHTIDMDFAGSCSVSFFFILSGFVMTLSYWNKVDDLSFSVISFLKKRIWKIYPLHLLTLFAASLISILALNYYQLICDIPNILLIHSWIPIREFYFSGNALSWYLSDMVFFYAICPYVIKKIKFKTFTYIYGLLIITSIVMVLIWSFLPDDYVHSIIYINPLMRFFEFYLGMCVCKLFMTIKNNSIGFAKASFFELLIVVPFVSAIGLFYLLPDRFSLTALWIIPNILIIFGFAIFENGGGFSQELFQVRHCKLLENTVSKFI